MSQVSSTGAVLFFTKLISLASAASKSALKKTFLLTGYIPTFWKPFMAFVIETASS